MRFLLQVAQTEFVQNERETPTFKKGGEFFERGVVVFFVVVIIIGVMFSSRCDKQYENKTTVYCLRRDKISAVLHNLF